MHRTNRNKRERKASEILARYGAFLEVQYSNKYEKFYWINYFNVFYPGTFTIRGVEAWIRTKFGEYLIPYYENGIIKKRKEGF